MIESRELSSLPKKLKRFRGIPYWIKAFLRERQPDPNFFNYQIGAYTSNKHKVLLLTESGRSIHRRMWGLSSCIYHLNAAPVRECIRKELCHRCPLLPSFRNTSPVEWFRYTSRILALLLPQRDAIRTCFSGLMKMNKEPGLPSL